MRDTPSSSDEPSPRRRADILADSVLVGLQLAFLVSSRLLQPSVLLDDAFIHFKYALSWGLGEGWVFNPGERVLGTTSPLWVFLLGFFHVLTGAEVPRVATSLNFGFDAGAMLLALHLLRHAGVGMMMRHGIALALGVEPLSMVNSVGGMEMSLFVLVILTALEGLRSGRAWLLGGALAVVGFIRPEGALLWGASVLALAATRARAFAVKSLGLAVAGAVVVAFCVWLAFGSVVPNTIWAKHLAPWYQKGGGICHTQFFATLASLPPFNALSGFEGIWGTPSDKVNTTLVALAQIVLMVLGVRWMWRHGAGAPGFAAGWLVVGIYLFYAATNPPIFPWYYVPYHALALLLGGVGGWQVIQFAAGRIPQRFSRLRAGLFLPLTFLWIALAVLNAASRGSGRHFTGWSQVESLRFRLLGTWDATREAAYRSIAERMNRWIRHNPGARVGCMEIGIFGYHFRGRTLDSYGLVSPEVLNLADPKVVAELPESCRSHPLNVFMTHKPEFIMAAGFMFPKRPAEFLELYEPMNVPEGVLAVFIRRDVKHEPWGFRPGDFRDPPPRPRWAVSADGR